MNTQSKHIHAHTRTQYSMGGGVFVLKTPHSPTPALICGERLKCAVILGALVLLWLGFCRLTDKARTLTTTSSPPSAAQPQASNPPSIYSCHSSTCSHNKYTRFTDQPLNNYRQIYLLFNRDKLGGKLMDAVSNGKLLGESVIRPVNTQV